MSDEVKISLRKCEALVIFEYLSRLAEKKNSLSLVDDAEEIAFNGLLSTLESALVEPFQPDYKELLNSAKKSLMDQ
jgi:hypothetical protein